MKKSILTLVMVTIVLMAITVPIHHEAHAAARAISTPWWTYTNAACNCWRCAPCADPDFTWFGVSTSFCACGPTPAGTRVWAWAWARPAWPPRAAFVSLLWVAWPDWAWGKGVPNGDTVVIRDTLDCYVDTLGGNFLLITQGDMAFYPHQAAEGGWAHAEVSVYERSHERDKAFWGKISINQTGVSAAGDYVGFGHTDWIDAYDTLHVAIYDTATFEYSGILDSLALDMGAHDRASQVPATTPWGLAVLIFLVVGSAIFVLVRIRRKATMAA